MEDLNKWTAQNSYYPFLLYIGRWKIHLKDQFIRKIFLKLSIKHKTYNVNLNPLHIWDNFNSSCQFYVWVIFLSTCPLSPVLFMSIKLTSTIRQAGLLLWGYELLYVWYNWLSITFVLSFIFYLKYVVQFASSGSDWLISSDATKNRRGYFTGANFTQIMLKLTSWFSQMICGIRHMA